MTPKTLERKLAKLNIGMVELSDGWSVGHERHPGHPQSRWLSRADHCGLTLEQVADWVRARETEAKRIAVAMDRLHGLLSTYGVSTRFRVDNGLTWQISKITADPLGSRSHHVIISDLSAEQVELWVDARLADTGLADGDVLSVEAAIDEPEISIDERNTLLRAAGVLRSLDREERQRWSHWLKAGEAVYLASQIAMRLTGANDRRSKRYKDKMRQIMLDHGLVNYRPSDLGSLSKDDRAALLNIYEEGTAAGAAPSQVVSEWRDRQPNAATLNNPVVVWRAYKKSLAGAAREPVVRRRSAADDLALARRTIEVQARALTTLFGVVRAHKVVAPITEDEVQAEIDAAAEDADQPVGVSH